MKKLIMIFAVAGALCSCRGNNRRTGNDNPDREQLLQQDVTAVDHTADEEAFGAHSAVNSLDYAGTYRGELPCADCEGIETFLTLSDDGKYELTTRYLGRGNGETYTDKGNFRWADDGSTIILDRGDEAATRYFVGEDYLYQLDLEGNRIEGDNAEAYRLEKQ